MPSDRPSSIVLTGYRACGKTSVGKHLADMESIPHVDTDRLIVDEAGCDIARIFETEGEAGFRVRETRAIECALSSLPAVISLGGGAVTVESNMTILSRACTIVWLTASADVLHARASADDSSSAARPPLTSLAGIDEVRQVLAERSGMYATWADVTIDTEDRRPADIAREIADTLAER